MSRQQSDFTAAGRGERDVKCGILSGQGRKERA